MDNALVPIASRNIIPLVPQKYYRTRREFGGGCKCSPAKYKQACQACKKQVEENGCIKRFFCGWCHTECNEYEHQRGLLMIRNAYNEVDHTDTYLQLEGNSIPLFLLDTDDHPTSQENTAQSHVPNFGTSQAHFEADRPAVARFTPCKRERAEDDDESPEKCTLTYRALPLVFTRGNQEKRQTSDEAEGKLEEEKPSTRKQTKEQCRILDYEPSEGEVVAVNALAGCGKTTTISLLCNKYRQEKNKRLLYLVFNKKNEEEASQSNKFPKEKMEIRTTHACILRYYFGEKKMKYVDSTSSRHDLDYIRDQADLYTECKSIFPNLEAKDKKAFERRVQRISSYTKKTLEKFLSSDKPRVEKSHVYWRSKDLGSERTKWKREGCERRPEKTKIMIPFDVYIKAAEVDNLVIPHNVIFIDEAQDMTPCQASIFWGKHKREGKIIYLFGDRHQQLYRFRGASDSFDTILQTSKLKMSLTGSFRFGHSIASLASYTLKAVGATDMVKGRAVNPGEVRNVRHVDSNRSLVVLCRTNQGVFQYLLENRPKKWSSLRFELPPRRLKKFVLDLEDFLWKRQRSFSYKSEEFTSPSAISDYVDDEGDSDLNRYFLLLSYLKEKETSMEDFLKQIHDSHCPLRCSPDHCNDRVVLGTVHKAKGLEFNNVLIYSDFKFGTILKAAHMNQGISNDEANTLYVATTRAKERLFLTDEAYEFFEQLKQTLGQLPDTKEIPKDMSDTRTQLLIDWNKLKESGTTIDSLNDIPWPPRDTLGFDRQMSESEHRSYTKALILIYHPDKFKQKFGQRCRSQEVYEAVVAEMARVFRDVIDSKQEERGWTV